MTLSTFLPKRLFTSPRHVALLLSLLPPPACAWTGSVAPSLAWGFRTHHHLPHNDHSLPPDHRTHEHDAVQKAAHPGLRCAAATIGGRQEGFGGAAGGFRRGRNPSSSPTPPRTTHPLTLTPLCPLSRCSAAPITPAEAIKYVDRDDASCVEEMTLSVDIKASTKAFLTHHVANISTVVQAADAHTVLSAAVSRTQRLSHGFA